MNARGPVALRPLAALTAVVVAAHLLVLQQAPTALNFGEAPPGRASALTTRTVAPPAPVPPAPAAVATPAPRPQPAKAPPAPKTAKPPATPSAAPLMPVDASNQAYSDVNDVELATPSGVNGTTTSPVSPGAPASAEVVVATAAPSSVPAAPAAGGVTLSATAPAPVRVLYNVTGQARNLPYSARAELLWRHDGRHYDARMEVSAFLVGSRTQTSEGDITPQGLAPRRFGDKSRNELAAHFNRDTQRIIFSANTPEAPLLPGAQDRLSLVLQLGALLAADPTRLAPGTSLTLQTVGPRDAEPWRITAEGEEQLNLPNGTLPARKFTRAPRREFDTRVELWLAPSLNYLPVRIRLTQANGDFVDQQMRSSEPLTDAK